MAKAVITVQVAHDIPEVKAYIETLERAVLKSWEGDFCAQCGTPFRFGHTIECIVPALIAKYEESG